MEFTYDHLLDALNTTIKPFGYEFKVEHEDDALSLKFFNGEDWEDYADGYYDEEMPELMFDAALFVLERIAGKTKNNSQENWQGECIDLMYDVLHN